MSDQRPLDYAASGVDIDRSDDVKHRIRAVVESTFPAGARGAFVRRGSGVPFPCRRHVDIQLQHICVCHSTGVAPVAGSCG